MLTLPITSAQYMMLAGSHKVSSLWLSPITNYAQIWQDHLLVRPYYWHGLA